MAPNPRFVVPVTYIQPEFAELQRRFPEGVHQGYARTKQHLYRKNADLTDREVTFEYMVLGRQANADDAHAEIIRLGFRPALYEELLCFALAHPEERMKHEVIALGSLTFLDDDDIYVPCLIHRKDQVLGLWYIGFYKTFPPELRYLVVRE